MKVTAVALAVGVLGGWFVTSQVWSGRMEAQRVEFLEREHAAERAAADREKQWAEGLERANREAARQLEDVRKSERAAADSRVRKAAAEYARRTPTADNCAADNRAAVLAELLADADEFAERVAAAADESRVRGLACERAYDSLRVAAE